MKLVAPAQDLTQDQDIAKDNNYGNTTFAAKPNIAELDVPEDIDKLDLVGGEEMEAVRIVLLLVHLQHPPVRVALNADDKILSRSQYATFNRNLRMKGSSMSMVVPSPASPVVPWLTLLTTPQRWTNSSSWLICTW